MLKKEYKISSQEFKRLFKKTSKKETEHFMFFLIKKRESCENSLTKISVILSKKKVKTAILRNKNKRIIYSIIRQIYPQLSYYHYLFISPKRDISNLENKLIKDEILSIL